jgi:hypothetical protein
MPRMVEESLPSVKETSPTKTSEGSSTITRPPALEALETLAVKGRAPKTGYARSEFGDGWAMVNGCTTRNIILHRDLENAQVNDTCSVVTGLLHDPYSGKEIQFTKEQSSLVQIDHVVALSDAWQKGAQQLTKAQRKQLANDPLELLAVAGTDNQAKGDGDAATWLPKNKSFRCQYIARQIAVKIKYTLWVTQAEKTAMQTVLAGCPNEPIP